MGSQKTNIFTPNIINLLFVLVNKSTRINAILITVCRLVKSPNFKTLF